MKKQGLVAGFDAWTFLGLRGGAMMDLADLAASGRPNLCQVHDEYCQVPFGGTN